MGIEKDTSLKFVGKNYLDIFFDLVDMPESVDSREIEELTEELISLRIAQFRPDFVGSDGNVIIMFEYESSYVGTKNKKRFHAYVALYDYEINDDNLDIVFFVITSVESSKIIHHKIGDTDSFKIIIVNLADLGFEKIISNAVYKIQNKIVFSEKEVVELALTVLMPETREKIIQQFYDISDMIDEIVFENEDAKTSFCGIILSLSNLYFDTDDEIRKDIQGVFMGKVDCIVEKCKEEFDSGYDTGYDTGFDEGVLKTARAMLVEGISTGKVCRVTGLSEKVIEDLCCDLNL